MHRRGGGEQSWIMGELIGIPWIRLFIHGCIKGVSPSSSSDAPSVVFQSPSRRLLLASQSGRKGKEIHVPFSFAGIRYEHRHHEYRRLNRRRRTGGATGGEPQQWMRVATSISHAVISLSAGIPHPLKRPLTFVAIHCKRGGGGGGNWESSRWRAQEGELGGLHICTCIFCCPSSEGAFRSGGVVNQVIINKPRTGGQEEEI